MGQGRGKTSWPQGQGRAELIGNGQRMGRFGLGRSGFGRTGGKSHNILPGVVMSQLAPSTSLGAVMSQCGMMS